MSLTRKLNFTRTVVGAVTAIATYSTAKAVIQSNVEEPETKSQRATLAVGSFVLASIVANSAEGWVLDKFDIFVGQVKSGVKDAQDKNSQA